MNTHDLIEKIRKTPGIYLGRESITALYHFLNGYHIAEYDNGIVNEPRKKLFPLDFYFMHEYTGFLLHLSAQAGWCGNILEACGGNEKEAFNRFFEIYDEFVRISMRGYYKAELTEDNIQFNNSMTKAYSIKGDRKEPVYRNPKTVYVIELSAPLYMLAVETKDYIKVEKCFFNSLEAAKGTGALAVGAEQYFGDIEKWEEFKCDNIEFDKNIE